jgi:plastocyanin
MRSLALAVVAGLLVCATGEGASPAAAAQTRKVATVKIAIEGMKFSPADVTVKAGDTVVWTNNDVVAHTVTSKEGVFDSKVIPPGATFKFVARRKGDFVYICSLHQPMTADLKVR